MSFPPHIEQRLRQAIETLRLSDVSEVITTHSLEVESIGRVYEDLLDHTARRASGSHYTPRSLTEPLVRATLEPLVFSGAVEGAPRGEWKLKPADELLRLKVCDPACGAGAFLIQAGRYLAWRVSEAWGGGDAGEAMRLVVRRCLYGVDINPVAVALTNLSLWLLTETGDLPGDFLDHAVRCGDALGAWPLDRAGFDAMLCNPPFINAIEGETSDAVKARLRDCYPQLRGTADLSYYFLARLHELTRARGTVGAILPRAFLSAPSARGLRATLHRERPPSMIYCPDGARHFHSANVRIVALTLGGGKVCHGGDEFPLREIEVEVEDWWKPIAASSVPVRQAFQPDVRPSQAGKPDVQRLGQHFEVVGSMTAGMAYDLLPFLGDEADGSNLRLVTTGLIEPAQCLWGEAPCRYLKRSFMHPRVATRPEMPASLRKRLELVRRPKVLVAGVAGPGHRVEAFVDGEGAFCGAVSTFTLFDRGDDVSRLDEVCAMLNSDETSRRVVERLGATAMGAGLLTITKDFLRNLPFNPPPK